MDKDKRSIPDGKTFLCPNAQRLWPWDPCSVLQLDKYEYPPFFEGFESDLVRLYLI
jgi:hypothetical protein